MLSRPASQRGDEEIREEDDQHDPPGEYARGSVQSMYLDEFFHLADCLGEGDEKPLQEVLQFGIDGMICCTLLTHLNRSRLITIVMPLH